MSPSTTSDERDILVVLIEEKAALIEAFRESAPAREAIAHWAFALFLARGAGHGKDLDDWLQAERALWAALPARMARP
jgi:hypothetical protein